MTNPGSEAVSVVALRDAFASFGASGPSPSDADIQGVRDRVCAVVRELKAAGAPPERVVALVKRLMADAEIDGLAHIIEERLVPWCIAEYFGPGA